MSKFSATPGESSKTPPTILDSKENQERLNNLMAGGNDPADTQKSMD